MAVEAFISYSHADGRALERMHKHLTMLTRDGALSTWSDHQILPGDKVGDQIDASLSKSGLFLALLSPDYLASKYCYETEFQKAQELAAKGQLRIVPIIVQPCDWQSSPFKDYLALPYDGKAVSEWTNENNAFLDVTKGLRRIIEGMKAPQPEPLMAVTKAAPMAPGRRPLIKKDFDAIQKAEFADQAFEAIRAYFEASCRELTEAGEGELKAKYERMDETAFTCTVINRGKRGAEAHITIRNGKGRNHFGDINYVFQKYAENNTSNGGIRVDSDDYRMFLTHDNYMRGGKEKLTAEQVADALWVDFVKQAGIEYG
ncbi:toll/interleukin-1 receptor domain-containing protein [Rubellimicrobium rubrum]|uniref:Toll/interleukin-1 receptor domain-containing protein n=1 Tax=Rubellimicrobium rubrum TaxID=2585369 RepID=A0A5C4MME2_9RHOB|nr:toll/interleukin-1 receptor domain-containing protein [Rubellimicrobium rubrum]TNC46496.1 toll/interleukin-1 receptor domain-containing protein [Rubellimicrobium rubrum]